VKTKIGVVAAALLIAWGLKRHYAGASADALWWILTPTAKLAGFMTRTTFEMQTGEGYLSRERLFLIEKSCAGVNFAIAAFGMLVFARLQRVESEIGALRLLGGSLLTGYAATVLVNAVRIAIAMWLAEHPLARGIFTAAAVHRIEGIIVFFGGLVMLHELVVQRPHTFRRPAVPLAAYYAVTLALPLANGAAGAPGFMQHALVVLAIPPVAIGIAVAGGAITNACFATRSWSESRSR
jgi:exosortase K